MADSLEDTEDCAAIDRAVGEHEAGETVSGEVVHAILEGTPLLRAWRRHRGLTLDALAERTGVSNGLSVPDQRMAGSRGRSICSAGLHSC